VYDLVIIGAGPAGITAAIYAVRKKMNFLVITGDVGGLTTWTRNIENYTGFHLIAGCDLVKRFREHLGRYNVEVKEGELATGLQIRGDVIIVTTTKRQYETKTLIIASGLAHKKLEVPGEDRLFGKGVAYCATCDAPVFAGVDVAVVGGGNSALDAVLQLVKIAKKVYLVDIEPHLRADPVMVEKARESEKVTFFHQAAVKEIRGDKFVSSILIEQRGHLKEVSVEGIFIEIGWRPSTEFAAELVARDRHGEIFVTCGSETNVPGIFAAGDVTSVPAKQIIVACGEGAKATLAAFNYLNRRQLRRVSGDREKTTAAERAAARTG
jgi:alkyl hydroperoxide reductase subunit F